jgi:hypothetical protein
MKGFLYWGTSVYARLLGVDTTKRPSGANSLDFLQELFVVVDVFNGLDADDDIEDVFALNRHMGHRSGL